MVFLENVPPQTVSWPNTPVQVRRPEGGIGPSDDKVDNNDNDDDVDEDVDDDGNGKENDNGAKGACRSLLIVFDDIELGDNDDEVDNNDNHDEKVDNKNNNDDVDDDGEENDNGANSAGRSPLIASQLPAAATNPALLLYSTKSTILLPHSTNLNEKMRRASNPKKT